MSFAITNKDKLNTVPVEDKQLVLSLDERRLYADIDSAGVVSRYPMFDPEYTAFEVFAHNYDIPVGECEELGGYVNYAIPADDTHYLELRVPFDNPAETDVVIDWGDGTIQKLADGDYTITSSESKDVALEVHHQYTEVTNSTEANFGKKYIVKIYGKDYYGFSTVLESSSTDWSICQKKNLICRCLDVDLPIASHITNLASAFKYSWRLLNVRLPEYSNIQGIKGFAYLFFRCINLLGVAGFKNQIMTCQNMTNSFNWCISLQECDLTAPALVERSESVGVHRLFQSSFCNFDTFMGENAFGGCKVLNVENMFNGTRFPEGTVIDGSKLWNRQDITWLKTSAVFVGCSEEIRAQVPASWGGTGDDATLIEKTYDERLTILEDVASQLATI